MLRWVTIVCAASYSLTGMADEQFYLREVKPVLRARCYACHGALKQESGLRLDTVASILEGGDSGPAALRGQPKSSLLIERVTAESDDERMPPDGPPLAPAEIDNIQAWIRTGTAAPQGETAEVDASGHWAFERPLAATYTTVSDQNLRNPVDALLAANRQSRGISTARVAPKNLLLRRVYLDLVGFPPEPDELRAFLEDTRPDAYERVVDRLLASPHYGERWGRHWMDVWRYSDWYGLGAQLRFSQKHIWRWRDWIIESLNADKGYDRMILEMIAGDELAPTDPDVLRATGFLARNYYLFNRTTWLDNTIEHTSKAFLGLTVNCAKCHDHKYDPITQVDYYRMRAIFETHQVRLDPVPGQVDLEMDGLPRAFDAHPDAPTYVHLRGDEQNPDQSRVMRPNVPAFFRFELSPGAIELPLSSHWPAAVPFVLQDRLARAQREIVSARDALKQVLADRATAAATEDPSDREPGMRLALAEKRLAAAKLHPPQLSTAFAADRAKVLGESNMDAMVHAAAIAARQRELSLAEFKLAEAELQAISSDAPTAEAARKKVELARDALKSARQKLAEPGTDYEPIRASRKALEGPAESEESRYQPYPKHSTGRRLALARWLIRRDHPLTARVAVNHMWMRHFGQPLVETVADFGRRANPPVQRQLLDTLAVELMQGDWRMKAIHRQIVTSHAYRLSGETNGAAQAARSRDPSNAFYWRKNPVRMESQVIRDSLLRLAGRRDSKLGGPPLDPSAKQDQHRRSIYFKHSRDDRDDFLGMFDDADIFRCYRRSESVVPQQALALSNSRLSLQMASLVASRLTERVSSAAPLNQDEQFVRQAFEMILCREPSVEESAACHDALRKWRRLASGDEDAKHELAEYGHLVHALLNHNDFVTIR